MVQSSSDQKLQFTFLKNISGADSNVEIIDIQKNTGFLVLSLVILIGLIVIGVVDSWALLSLLSKSRRY